MVENMDIEEQPAESGHAATNNDLPPSYASLYKDFKQADSPKSYLTVGTNAFTHMACNTGVNLCTVLLNIIPICSVVIGIIHYDHCTIKPIIPTWLIVTGGISLLKVACDIFLQFFSNGGTLKGIGCCSCLVFLINVAGVIWFILGSIWVLSPYDNVQYDPATPETYCHKLLYIWSLVIILVGLILTGLGFLICFCFCCCLCVGLAKS